MIIRISTITLKLLVIILSILTFLLATPWGSKSAVSIANTLPLLTLDYRSGTVVDGIVFNKVTVNLPEVKIEVTDVTIELRLRCLVKQQLCVNNISGDDFVLHVDTKTAEEEIPVIPAADNQLIDIPFSYQFDALYFDSVLVTVDDLAIAVQKFSAAGLVGAELVKIDQANSSDVTITLPSDDETVQSQPTQIEEWPLASLPEISLPLDLQINKTSVNKLAIVFADDKQNDNLGASNINTTFRWINKSLDIKKLQLEKEALGITAIKGNVTFSSPYVSDLNAKTKVYARPEIGLLKDLKLSNTLKGRLDDLNISLTMKDSIEGNASMHGDVTSANLPFSVKGAIEHITMAEEIADKFTLGQLTFAIDGDLQQQKFDTSLDFGVPSFSAANLIFSGTIAEDTLDISVFTLTESSTVSDLSLAGEISYLAEQEAIDWQLSFRSNNLTLPEISPEISGNLRGELKSSGNIPASNFIDDFSKIYDNTAKTKHFITIDEAKLHGILNEVPFMLSGNINVDQSFSIRPSELVLEALDTELTIKGEAKENWQLVGKIVNQDLTSLMPNLAGSNNATFTVTGPIDAPIIALKNTSQALAVINEDVELINFEDLTFDITYQPMNDHQTSLALTSNTIDIGALGLEDLTLSLDGNINQQTMSVSWLGDLAAEIETSSQWLPENEQFTLTVAKSDLRYEAYDFGAQSPIVFTYDLNQNNLNFSVHCWAGLDIELCFNEESNIGEAGNINANIKIDTASLNQHFHSEALAVDTQISGNFQTKWLANEFPTMSADFDIAEGVIKHTLNDQSIEVVKWRAGTAFLSLTDKEILQTFALTKSDDSPLVDINTRISVAQANELEGKIFVDTLNLRPLKAFAPIVDEMDATLSSQLSLGGTLTQPTVDGDVTLKATTITFNRSLTTLNDITLVTTLGGKNADITGGLLVDDKPVQISGNLNWQEQLTASANIQTDSVDFSSPPDLTIELGTNIDLHYQADLLEINGRVDVLDGKLAIDELPEGSVNVSDDVVIVDDEGEVVVKETRLLIKTNVDVNIDDKFELEGYGFEGDLGGGLTIQQEPKQPLRVNGVLNISNGTYQAYGQRLQVSEGKVVFNGPPDNPFVDFKAERFIKKDSIHVGLTVRGLINALQLTLFSSPQKEQPDILSYLVRGRGLDEGTGNTAALGIALGTSLTKASNITEVLEQLPIFHNIALDTEMDGDHAQATISGYVGDRIYMKYGVGIYDPVTEVTVRFYLLSKLWIESVTNIENSIDIYYSFDVE